MITQACKNAENWTEKDMIYTVGILHANKLKHLCMVYGSDYCASTEVYERMKEKIKSGVAQIPNIELVETKELGKFNRVDPLGITYLRVRGMWGIENPFKVFNYVFTRDMKKDFNFMAIINKEKYLSFSNAADLEALANTNKDLQIKDIMIKNPDNPAKLKEAKLICFSV